MNSENVICYLVAKQLPEFKLRKYKGEVSERKTPRFDVTGIAGWWGCLDAIKSKKGELHFLLVESVKNANRENTLSAPEYYLQCCVPSFGTLNFSGLRFEYDGKKRLSVASGEPSNQKMLKSGANPMYDFHEDGFLFRFSEDMQTLEIIIIKSGACLIDAYRTQLLVGGYDTLIRKMVKNLKSFNYSL